MSPYIRIFLAFPLLSLAGCASVTTGQNQSISVSTTPISGAQCKLTNDKGSWFVSSTPGSVTVTRAYSDLNIVCNKDDYLGQTTVASSTKGMAFGNILLGGVIGAGVDVATGSAYDYPVTIDVPMKQEVKG